MTSRGKNAVRSFETEIEKSREESNWKKAVELAQQLKAKSPQHESLAHFLIGEGKLEAYLDEWPPSKDNIERAQRELSEARGYLTLATDEAGKKAGVALDAHLLLGKLNYACGYYEDALKHYALAELNTLTEKELPVRSLRIVAESYAIKGLCLEQEAVPGSSRFKQAEHEKEMVGSFELASELALLYLQRGAGGAGGGGARAGPALELALQRAPLLHVRARRLHSAVHRYRAMLCAVEAPSTHAFRLALARQLAELLMRALSGEEYRPPEEPAPGARRRDDHASDGPWKPKRYAAINQFVPCKPQEEIILLLLVGEAMAVRDAVLSQSAEFEAARAHALANAVAVCDLLAVCVVRWGQLCLVLESLERAMKFSFGCAHVWRQRALAAAAAAPAPPAGLARDPPPALPGSAAWTASVRAHAVLRRAAPLAPRDAALRLLGADTCYRSGWVEEGIELANAALAIEDERNGPLLARCCLFAGIGYQRLAQKTNSRIDKDAASDKCLKLLLRSVTLDDNDHLAFYHLALAYMQLGRLNDAMDATRACLAAQAESAGGLRLAAALWSAAAAGARGRRALAAARLARARYPAALWPLAALCALQLKWESGEAALATGKQLLAQLGAEPACDDASDAHADALSVAHAPSVRAEWGARAPSSVASAQSARPPPAAPRAQAWLLLADLCLRLLIVWLVIVIDVGVALPQAGPRVGGGGLRGRGGGAGAARAARAAHARLGARGERRVGRGAAVLPGRAGARAHASRQRRTPRRGVLQPRLAAPGREDAPRGGRHGADARRHVAAPGAGAGGAGRAGRRRRHGRRRAGAAARHAPAALGRYGNQPCATTQLRRAIYLLARRQATPD